MKAISYQLKSLIYIYLVTTYGFFHTTTKTKLSAEMKK